MSNVIFVPVGIPIGFHGAYDKENHWRYNKSTRNYQTVAYNYNDYRIEEGTYDIVVKDKGFKWQMARHFLDTFDYKDYEYIGFWDDDLITDIQSVNRGLEIAKENGLKIWQLSTIAGSDSSHGVLHQDVNLKYTTTNFNEGMGVFFHSSLIPTLLKFWEYHEVKSGYGFDLIFSAITKEKCGVIHERSMYHPAKPSYYNIGEAIKEQNHITRNVYPKFMKDTYNENVTAFNEPRKVYEIVIKG